MANRNFPNGGKLYIPHVKPVLVDCNFVVDSTNANGLGIRSLKGSYVQAVRMHTSATPAAGPNPAAGYIYVKLKDNYNQYLGGFSGQVSPLSGSSVTSTTSGLAYVIVSLGTTTLAQWQAAGFPLGFTPAVGSAFIATATGAIGGTGAVQAPAAAGSGINRIEVIGDPNLTFANSAQPSNGGGYMILACFLSTTITAPTDGSVMSLAFYINDSSVPTG